MMKINRPHLYGILLSVCSQCAAIALTNEDKELNVAGVCSESISAVSFDSIDNSGFPGIGVGLAFARKTIGVSAVVCKKIHNGVFVYAGASKGWKDLNINWSKGVAKAIGITFRIKLR